MKSIVILLTFLTVYTNAFSQKLDYESDSKWYLGLNIGATWNTLDVKNKTNFGYGLVLGRSLNYDYGKIFSFDIRLRYLRGKWYGQDLKSTDVTAENYDVNGTIYQNYNTLGYTYNNFEADVHHVGLEFAVHFNKLIERTGFDPYIFGGANLVFNQTYGDLINQDSLSGSGLGSAYNYPADNISNSELNALVDGIHDTPLRGSTKSFKTQFMPSFGIGLAYQIGPRFSLGLEHLMTFTLNDDFDGFRQESLHWGMFKNDVYHYSALSLKFNFRSRGSKQTKPTRPNTDQTNTPPPPVDKGCDEPMIELLSPNKNNVTTDNAAYNLKFNVKNVESVAKITVTKNGQRYDSLSYEPIDEVLSGKVNLDKGKNTFVIEATNECGTTSQTIEITYNCKKPVVYMLQPKMQKTSVRDPNYTIQSEISYAETIELYINGIQSDNFIYTASDKKFASTQRLQKGENTFKIVATNACGTSEQQFVVDYTNCIPPTLLIPQSSEVIISDNPNYSFYATSTGITSKSQVTVTVNGVRSAFTLSNGKIAGKATLKVGQNVIQITVKNECGEVSKMISIDYQKEQKITICLRGKTMTILQSEWATYQAQGATLGECPTVDPKITICLRGKTMTILQSQWATFQGQGATLGECPVIDKEITICLNGTTMTILESQWAMYKAEGAKLGECPIVDQEITICLRGKTMTILQSQWATFQGQGATLGECPVIDKEITICLNGTTMTILESQWAMYKAKGAKAGECPEVDKEITICLRGKTMTILESQWPQYKIKGAILGECPEVDEEVIICYKRKQLTILESQWEEYKAKGAILGECPELKIKICLNGETLEVPQSQWATYQAKGATLGECREVQKEEITPPPPVPTRKITICFEGETLSIPLTQWVSYQSKGATKGECPEETEETSTGRDLKITICHRPPGNPTNTQEISIPESAWPAHEAHGDTKGKCETDKDDLTAPQPTPSRKITICFNGKTLSIPQAEWASYQAKGATIGACPEETEEEESAEEEGNGNKKITICHKPPGNPTNTQEISIPASAWPAHQAHGDTMGPCAEEDKMITICVKVKGVEETKEIKESEWAIYKARGAKKGACK